jgi:hypothetical protein
MNSKQKESFKTPQFRHAERSEASALRFTNSFYPETLKNRFFVTTLLRMTYESKSLIGALRAPVRRPGAAESGSFR